MKLTLPEVVELLRSGVYTVDFENGRVLRKNKPIYTYTDGRKSQPKADQGYLWCRLYSNGKKRSISVSNVVWMAKTLTPIPEGFEIHHRDRNKQNNCWWNLYCLHKNDHEKLHNADIIETETTHEEVPF